MAEFGSNDKKEAGKICLPIGSSDVHYKDGWNQEKVLEDKHPRDGGKRKNPSEYLEDSYIKSHSAKFARGATRIQLRSTITNPLTDEIWDPLGRDKVFVFPTEEFERIIEAANGDIAKVEEMLGLDKGQLIPDNETDYLVRIDIPPPIEAEMPSGNENSANDHWLPGGLLPTGVPEAVINPLPKGAYKAEEFKF